MIWDLIVGPFAGWIAGAVGAFVLLLGAWWSGKRSGAVRAENKGLRDTAKGYEVRNEIDNRVAGERDARDKLRTDWPDQ